MRVTLEPYNPAWKEAFRRHRAIIGNALGDLHPAIDWFLGQPGNEALKTSLGSGGEFRREV